MPVVSPGIPADVTDRPDYCTCPLQKKRCDDQYEVEFNRLLLCLIEVMSKHLGVAGLPFAALGINENPTVRPIRKEALMYSSEEMNISLKGVRHLAAGLLALYEGAESMNDVRTWSEVLSRKKCRAKISLAQTECPNCGSSYLRGL